MTKKYVYSPPSNIKVKGGTAPNGKPYIRVAASGKSAWIPRDAFTTGGAKALRMLSAAGISLLPDEWKQCRRKVAKLAHYPATPLIDRPGWNGEHFALASGEVFSPSRTEKPVVLFPRNSQKCASSGSIGAWRDLTGLLADQPLASFILLAAYAGPFLSMTNLFMNQGFELAGSGGTGKSTLQRLAAAVCGPADDPSGLNYWITANTTSNGLEPVMAEHNDMVIIIDDSNLFAAGEADVKRAVQFNRLVFELGDGTAKRRFGVDQPPRSRFGFITSTNEPLPQLLSGSRTAVKEAAGDRLLTLPIDDSRPYGVFDCLPKGWPNSSALAGHFNQEIRKCYGVGIRQLLRHLVREKAKDEAAVVKELQTLMDQFRKKVGVDANDGSKTRVADAFGLVFAVGKFAKRYKAVSPLLDPLQAALTCYELNQASRQKPPSFLKQLRALATEWDSLNIRQDKLGELTDYELTEASVIVRLRRDEKHELLFTHEQLVRAFRDLRAFFADPEIRQLVIAEKGRKQTKRQIRTNKGPERFYCFQMPETWKEIRA